MMIKFAWWGGEQCHPLAARKAKSSLPTHCLLFQERAVARCLPFLSPGPSRVSGTGEVGTVILEIFI
jgi:hypothetical protein